MYFKVDFLAYNCSFTLYQVFPGGSDSKESTCNAGDLGSIPELGRSPGGGHAWSILAWRIPWTEEPGGLQSQKSPTQLRDSTTRKASLASNAEAAWR